MKSPYHKYESEPHLAIYCSFGRHTLSDLFLLLSSFDPESSTLVNVGIPNAKCWRRGNCPTPTPDAIYFASQWNIGFTLLTLDLEHNNISAIMIPFAVLGHIYYITLKVVKNRFHLAIYITVLLDPTPSSPQSGPQD